MNDITNMDDCLSTSKSPPLSFRRKNTPAPVRRSSSTISSRTAASQRHESGDRGGISKRRASGSRRIQPKGPPQTRKKKVDVVLNFDMEDEIYDDNDISGSNLQQGDNDEQQRARNSSSASADTIITPILKKKIQEKKRTVEYFSIIGERDKVKCSLCQREIKYDTNSDTNLRSHLGFKHGIREYLFPSQLKRKYPPHQKSPISSHLKKEFDAAGIQCIVDDGLAFGTFRRCGMKKFLTTIMPGYVGPSRQTVRKKLDKLYQERRSMLRDMFKDIPYISLTTDLWLNSRRHYYLVITAHYLVNCTSKSTIISFRRFSGRHLSSRLKSFIVKELKKLKIETKIISITTDNGSDIKAATTAYEFGTRYSCDAHNINRLVSTALGLWKIPKSKKTNNSTSTTSDNDFDHEFDEIRLIDVDQVSDECIEQDSDDSEDEDDEVPAPINEDESDSSSESSSSEEDDYDSIVSQEKEQLEGEEELGEEDKELQMLLSNPEDLKKKIHGLLKRTRTLISAIHKSSILTSFIRQQARRQEIELAALMSSDSEEKIKLNDLVKDFHVRWNSTFLMLTRLLTFEQVINDITYTPHVQAGLNKKQIKKLKSLANTPIDWELLRSLYNVLAPFYWATRCLSGRKYTTLALSYWVTQNLRLFLTEEAPESPIENAMKVLLLSKFKLYFDTKSTLEQKHGKLIAAYLDPFTLHDLSIEEINEAEKLVLTENKKRDEGKQKTSTNTATSRLLSQQSRSSFFSPATTSKHYTSSIPSVIDRFKSSCRCSSTTNEVISNISKKSKPLTIKQELSLYLSSCQQTDEFEKFWNEKQHVFPILFSFVCRYSIIPATSVPSESAFSVAGYIDRKQRSSLSSTTLRYLMLLKK